MKGGFLSGVIVTVIGGALVFAGNAAYDSWREGRQKVVEYTIDESAVIVDPELLSAVSALQAGQQIATIRIANEGLSDLANLELEITDVISPAGENIINFGVLKKVGERIETPSTKKVDGNIHVEFEIFRPDEEVFIWIANEGYSRFDIRNAQPGVYLDENSINISSDFDFGSIIIYSIGIILSFIAGAIMADRFNNHILKRVGFDPEEILELYQKNNNVEKD